VVIRNGLPVSDSDADRHQNVISLSLGHPYTPPRNFVKIRSQFFQLSVGSNRVKVWVGGKLGKEWLILTSNELDLTFWVPDYGAVSSKSSDNCDRRRVDRQTDRQTQASRPK